MSTKEQKTSQQEANQEKSQNGANNQRKLNDILQECKKKEWITDVIVGFKSGDEDFNPKQFFVQFLIQFHDRTRWVLHSTTSLRDRVKEQQWDMFNLKRLDPMIVGAFLVYDDNIETTEKKKFQNLSEKISKREVFSAIDNIFSFSELEKEIEKTAFSEPDTPLQKTTNSLEIQSTTEKGKKWDKDGRQFETRIANIMNNPNYLQKWNTGLRSASDFSYSVFLDFMQKFNLKRGEINKIEASSDRTVIGLLPSGGSPKTDIIINVYMHDGSMKVFTVSCKRTNEPKVSFHQYSAETFANVLDKGNDTLRTLLGDFQHYGNMRDFPDKNKLTEHLKPYVKKLIMWVLSGEGGSYEKKEQIAQYLATYNPEIDKFSIHTIDEYYNELIKLREQNFGTPFQWTYASGQKGKSIQLKCPVL